MTKPAPHAARRLLDAAHAALAALVPPGWRTEATHRSEVGGTIRVTSPDEVTAQLTVWARDDLSPRDAVALPEPQGPTVIAASWLSPRTRELLDDVGFGYVDQTGNANVTVDRPGLAVRSQGARRNPSPKPATRPNIRGPRAWALMRTLVEVQPPFGVSDLASAVGADPGYISRLLTALADELLITRVPRGPVEHVEWEPMLRQFAASYALLDANEATSWVASAGPEQFVRDLAASRSNDWAITGSFAAAHLVSVTAPQIAVVYADDPEQVAAATRLRQVRTGGNVVVARPYDRIVFARTWRRDDVVYTSPAQATVDCLTGPGRMPAEGEALIDWLRRNTPYWQAPSLHSHAGLP